MNQKQQQHFKNQPVCVLRVNIHCDGCEKKVRKALKKIQGVESSFIDAEQGKVTVSGYVHPNTIIKKLEKFGKQAELWGPPMKSFDHGNFKKNQVSDIEYEDFDMKKMKPHQQKGGKGFKDMSVNLAPKAPKSAKFECGESDGEFGDESDGFEVDFGRRPPPRTPGRGGVGKSGVVVKKAKKGGIFRVLLRRLFGKSKGKGGKGGKKAAATSGGIRGGGKAKRGGKNGDWMMESGKNGGKNMSMVVGNNGGKKGKNLDFEIDVGNHKKGARGGGGYGQGGGGGANGHHRGGGGGGGYDGQGRATSGGHMYEIGGRGGDSGSYGGGRFAGQMGQVGHMGQAGHMGQTGHMGRSGLMGQISHMSQMGQMGNPQMMGNQQMGPTSTHQMGHPMGQMGNHQVPQMGHHSMGQMGFAPTMMNGGGGEYYQGMVAAPANPYNHQDMAMMMNQQRVQGNGMHHRPLMYERRPNPMASYDPPRPSGGYTHMFSDENTESCSIM